MEYNINHANKFGNMITTFESLRIIDSSIRNDFIMWRLVQYISFTKSWSDGNTLSKHGAS
jgi:hypothetical protein